MPPEPPPLPVSGTFTLATGRLLLLFDRLLTIGPLATGPWSVLAGSNTWNADTIAVLGGDPLTVDGIFSITGGAFPGSELDYSPPPFTLLGATGVPAAAIVNFPITVI